MEQVEQPGRKQVDQKASHAAIAGPLVYAFIILAVAGSGLFIMVQKEGAGTAAPQVGSRSMMLFRVVFLLVAALAFAAARLLTSWGLPRAIRNRLDPSTPVTDELDLLGFIYMMTLFIWALFSVPVFGGSVLMMAGRSYLDLALFAFLSGCMVVLFHPTKKMWLEWLQKAEVEVRDDRASGEVPTSGGALPQPTSVLKCRKVGELKPNPVRIVSYATLAVAVVIGISRVWLHGSLPVWVVFFLGAIAVVGAIELLVSVVAVATRRLPQNEAIALMLAGGMAFLLAFNELRRLL